VSQYTPRHPIAETKTNTDIEAETYICMSATVSPQSNAENTAAATTSIAPRGLSGLAAATTTGAAVAMSSSGW
jgi:hypothetical protein